MEGVVRIKAEWAGRASDRRILEQLHADIARLGQVVTPTGSPPEGVKGVPLPELATIAIAVVSTPAVAALVNILKSYVERDRDIEIEVTDDEGTFKIKAADWRSLDRLQLVDRLVKGRRPAD